MNTANGTQMKIIGIQSVRESKQWARLFMEIEICPSSRAMKICYRKNGGFKLTACKLFLVFSAHL